MLNVKFLTRSLLFSSFLVSLSSANAMLDDTYDLNLKSQKLSPQKNYEEGTLLTKGFAQKITAEIVDYHNQSISHDTTLRVDFIDDTGATTTTKLTHEIPVIEAQEIYDAEIIKLGKNIESIRLGIEEVNKETPGYASAPFNPENLKNLQDEMIELKAYRSFFESIK